MISFQKYCSDHFLLKNRLFEKFSPPYMCLQSHYSCDRAIYLSYKIYNLTHIMILNALNIQTQIF